MPHEIFWEPHGVLRRFTGLVSGKEVVRSFHELSSDPRFDMARYSIADFTGATAADTTADEFTDIAALHLGVGIANTRLLYVEVATDAKILANIARLKSTAIMPERYRIFATLAEARTWLAVQPY